MRQHINFLGTNTIVFQHSTLQLVGSDPKALTLGDHLGLKWCCRPRGFEVDGAQMPIALLSIIEAELPEEVGGTRTLEWLSQNRQKLELLSGTLTVEILCSLSIEDGSRFLRIDAEAIELLFDLECDLLFQYGREFSPGEIKSNVFDSGSQKG